MSQMYPSSSHQLVAAGFRRARKKFPTNFGQFSWPIKYERKDSKPEQLQSSTRCKKCEELFGSSLIRNVRSSNVWPRFAPSWTTDHRGGRSIRDNDSLSRRINVERTNRAGCDCRRIRGSSRRNVAVSFSEGGKSSSRCSGGDFVEERTSVETISSKSCRSRLRRSVCSSVERVGEALAEKRERNERKSKTKLRSCTLADEPSTNRQKIGRLDLRYRRNDGAKNSISLSSDGKEHDANDSPEDDGDGLDFPSKLNEWENRSREDTIRPGSGLRGVTGDETVVNCSCAGKNGQPRGNDYQGHRHRSHKPRFERNQHRRESSLYRELLLRAGGSRAACPTKETNRLCKYCPCGRCSRNSSLVQSQGEDEDEADEQCGGARGDDVCAIKHKDSMAILVEKFKNKRNNGSCSDDEAVFRSDEETTPRITRSGERKIVRDHREVEFESGDVASWNVRGNNETPTPEARKFHKNQKSLKSRSGCCCSAKEVSYRHAS